MKLSFYDHRLRAGADPICLESESSLGLRTYEYGAITGAGAAPKSGCSAKLGFTQPI